MDDVLPPASYAPDGLYESDVDALIAEYFTADEPAPERASTNQQVRWLNRQPDNAAVKPPHADNTAA